MDCAFTGNTALYGGGGIDNETDNSSSLITLIHCAVTGNTASYGGSGVFNNNGGDLIGGGGVIQLTDCVADGNTGGGISNGSSSFQGMTILTRCAITGNTTGSGLYNNTSYTVLTDCAITENSTDGDGGGIFNDNGGKLTLTNCVIAENSAVNSDGYRGEGGGIYNSVYNNTITMTNCTVTGNRATVSSGIFDGGGTLTLTNDIIYGDLAASGGDMTASGGEITRSSGSVTVTYCDIGGGYAGTGNINANPRFVHAPADQHLLAGSPCLGAGTPTGAPNADKDGKVRPNPPGQGAYEEAAAVVATTTTLTSSLNPSVAGQPVTLTATVTTALGDYVPTGAIQFKIDGSPYGTPVTLNSDGQVFLKPGLLPGTHSVTATYAPTEIFTGSAGTLAQIVTAHVSPVYVSPSGNDSSAGTQAAPKATIQGAIHATLNDDTVIVEDGVYRGPGNRDIDFGGKNITVMSQNGAATTIIDCGGDADPHDGTGIHRGFYFHSGETNAVVSGLTIQNGYQVYFPTQPDSGTGGGIFIENTLPGGHVTVRNCVLLQNTALGSGGGIYGNSAGTITLTGCALEGNTASEGGGMDTSSAGTVSLTHCRITANTAGIAGGGVAINNYPGGTITLTNCAIEGNSGAQAGGGVYNNNAGGALTMTNCAMIGNNAAYGGGVCSGNISGSALTITGCAVEGNTAQYGGGLENDNGGGLFIVSNCVLTGNTASVYAGGMYNASDYSSAPNNGLLTVINCSLSGNTAPSGAGGGLYNSNHYGGTIALTNDICYGDQGGEVVNDTYYQPDPLVTFCDIQGGYAGTGDIDADPLFVNAAAGDLHLRPGSLCVGLGTAAGAPLKDKDGLTRPDPPSQGAYELGPGHAHILWNNVNGQASLWTVNPDGTFASAVYGPFSGWTAKATAAAPDGTNWLLWTNTNGTAALWHVTALTSTGYTATQYGPFANYAAVSLSVDTGGNPRLLWDKSDGTASLWTLAGDVFGSFTHTEYGPFPGWTAKAVASGPTQTDLLWTNTDGSATFWNVTGRGDTDTVYGPYAGWNAEALSVGPDDKGHLLWDNMNGQASLWALSGDLFGTFTPVEYGPFSGYAARAIATGPDNVTHILWNATNGVASLWNVTGSGYTYHAYGPFAGWTAVGMSAGP